MLQTGRNFVLLQSFPLEITFFQFLSKRFSCYVKGNLANLLVYAEKRKVGLRLLKAWIVFCFLHKVLLEPL